MAVEVNVDRIAVELTYDDAEVQGDTINVRAVNDADGDVSTRDDLKNDGRFVWTYPADFEGQTTFTVAGDEGGSDTGLVAVSGGVAKSVGAEEETEDEE
jgi:hypothetical protein